MDTVPESGSRQEGVTYLRVGFGESGFALSQEVGALQLIYYSSQREFVNYCCIDVFVGR